MAHGQNSSNCDPITHPQMILIWWWFNKIDWFFFIQNKIQYVCITHKINFDEARKYTFSEFSKKSWSRFCVGVCIRFNAYQVYHLYFWLKFKSKNWNNLNVDVSQNSERYFLTFMSIIKKPIDFPFFESTPCKDFNSSWLTVKP